MSDYTARNNIIVILYPILHLINRIRIRLGFCLDVKNLGQKLIPPDSKSGLVKNLS